jgi:hypothetical protein
VSYEINQAGFIPVKGLHVQNQFQDELVNLARPDFLMVPSNKAIGDVPPAASPAAINHYRCYRVVRSKFRIDDVKIDDQFGTINVDIKRPVRFCAATSKNGEPVIDSDGHLMCYQVRPVTGSPRFKGPKISINNQFGPAGFKVFGARELCLPTVILNVD